MGIYVPEDMAAVVIAAFEKWLSTTNQGREHIVNMYGFDWIAGSQEFTYDIRDEYGRCLDKLSHDQIFFLQAVVARGNFVPASQVTLRPVDKKGCDTCGILSHCTREVGSKAVCNHCLYHSEDRDLSGGRKECEGCMAMGCDHHPSKERRLA